MKLVSASRFLHLLFSHTVSNAKFPDTISQTETGKLRCWCTYLVRQKSRDPEQNFRPSYVTEEDSRVEKRRREVPGGRNAAKRYPRKATRCGLLDRSHSLHGVVSTNVRRFTNPETVILLTGVTARNRVRTLESLELD